MPSSANRTEVKDARYDAQTRFRRKEALKRVQEKSKAWRNNQLGPNNYPMKKAIYACDAATVQKRRQVKNAVEHIMDHTTLLGMLNLQSDAEDGAIGRAYRKMALEIKRSGSTSASDALQKLNMQYNAYKGL